MFSDTARATILDSLSDLAERSRDSLYTTEDPEYRLLLTEDAERADSIAELVEEGEPLDPDALYIVSDALDYNIEVCQDFDDLDDALAEYQAALDEVTALRFPKLIETLREAAKIFPSAP